MPNYNTEFMGGILLQPFQKTLAVPIFFLICYQQLPKWMTSNLGKCGMGYLDDKLPQDAHYSVNSGTIYIRRDAFQFLPIFVV